MDIAETVGDITFCGTLRAGGLRARGDDGRLVVGTEGRIARAVPAVQAVVFNGVKMRDQGKRVRYVTERAVFELTDNGVTLTEVAPGIDLERDVLDQMLFTPKLADDLRTMDERIFRPGPMGLLAQWSRRGPVAAGAAPPPGA
jgi:propionate CoA-transferase